MLDVLAVFSLTGVLPDEPSSPKELLEFLISFGAKPEISSAACQSLAEYTNKGKADGLREVWGEKFSAFKEFTAAYVRIYEGETGHTLPALQPSGVKTSGLIAFFGELTAYAYGAMDWPTFKLYSETRWHNGKLWRDGRKDERIRLEVPTSEEPKLISSYPPGYPQDVIDFMRRGFRLI